MLNKKSKGKATQNEGSEGHCTGRASEGKIPKNDGNHLTVKPKRVIILTVAALVMLTASLLSVFSYGITQYDTEVLSAEISKDKSSITIEATFSNEDAEKYNGQRLFLFELKPQNSTASISACSPVTEKTVSGNKYTFTLGFDKASEQVYSRYLLATIDADGNYVILTKEHPIDNLTSVSENTYEYPKYASKKGLSFKLLSDAQRIGTSHTVVNVPVNEFITSESDQTAAEFCGNTYYIDTARLDVLDYTVRSYTESGINVYLNIILTSKDRSIDSASDVLYQYAEKSTTATYYAVSTSEKGIRCFEAFLSFIARRYTDEKATYGFAGSYIIGYEINSNRYYNFMGDTEEEAYLDSYAAVFRAADAAVRTAYSNAKLYVSVANNFTEPQVSKRVTYSDKLDYTARSVLDGLAERIGDIPWNIATYPYASDYELTEIWNDNGAVSGFGTEYITMENIDVLCEYIGQSEFLYNGEKRKITIAEFGVNSAPGNTEALNKQAAAYAYAYYKAEALDTIDAFIYYSQIDGCNENGICFGLWTNANPQGECCGDTKPIYKVYKYIDSAKSAEITQEYLGLLGIEAWSELVPAFDASDTEKVKYFENEGTTARSRVSNTRKYRLFDFTAGSLLGFMPTENTKQIMLSEASGLTNKDGTVKKVDVLLAELVGDGGSGYMGVGRYFPNKLNLKNMLYASVTIKVEAPVSLSGVKVMLRMYTVNGESYDAEYEGSCVISSGNWVTVYFDIGELTSAVNEIDGMKIWISAPGAGADMDYYFWLSDVSIYTKSQSLATKISLLSGAIICAGISVFSLVIIILRLKAKKNAKARAEAAKRARANSAAINRATVMNAVNSVSVKKNVRGTERDNVSGQKALKERFDLVHKFKEGKK